MEENYELKKGSKVHYPMIPQKNSISNSIYRLKAAQLHFEGMLAFFHALFKAYI